MIDILTKTHPHVRKNIYIYIFFFLIWTAGEEALKQFIQEINQCHDSIKFEVKYSRTKINFLDVLIHLSKEGVITTSLYKKPTDRNGYLHHSSYHPIEQIRNIPFGQYLRAKKICSNSNEAKKSMHEIASKLNNRGYPKSDTEAQMTKAESVPREALLIDKTANDEQRIPFTATFNKDLPPIRKIINKHWGLLQTHRDLAPIFKNKPIVAFKRNRNLRDLIGQMHLSNGKKILPQKRPNIPGCAPCLSTTKNKCCRQITSAKNFKSEQTGEIFEIRHRLNCKSRNCIYLGYCIKCRKNQYVGKAETPAHQRFNTHRYDVTRPSGLMFDKHFDQDDHNFDHHARFVLIEQVKNHHNFTKLENRAILEEREDFWIQKLKTLAPSGLNDRLNSAVKSRIQAICN